MPSNKGWGSFFEGLIIVASTPIALAKGLIDVSDGKSFQKGADAVFDGAGKIGKDFGEKHGQHIEKTLVTGAVIATGAFAAKNLGVKINPANKK